MAARLMTPQEVATYLGVSVATLYGWRSRNTGPNGLRIGKYLRFHQSEVEAWVLSRADGVRAVSAQSGKSPSVMSHR